MKKTKVENVDKGGKERMRILAIETSCDETAVAIIEGASGEADISVLANALISQIEIHKPYGGVFPTLAKREHEKNLPILLSKALREAGVAMEEIGIIAVTNGPGLEPALWVGINFAEELGRKHGKPVMPINHMEGHIAAALLLRMQNSKFKIQNFDFPAIALLISGGHTELVLMKNWFEYEVVGETRDDAAGECFDKTARILGLPYPGGPEISRLAEEFRSAHSTTLRATRYALPRPMLHSRDFDFSFSGLKTAALYTVRKIALTDETRCEIAYEIEEAITDVLSAKTLAAAKKFGVKSVILGGGVAANKHIREIFGKKISAEIPSARLLLPEKHLTTDNALMIALAAHLRLAHNKAKAPKTLEARSNLRLDE